MAAIERADRRPFWSGVACRTTAREYTHRNGRGMQVNERCAKVSSAKHTQAAMGAFQIRGSTADTPVPPLGSLKLVGFKCGRADGELDRDPPLLYRYVLTSARGGALCAWQEICLNSRDLSNVGDGVVSESSCDDATGAAAAAGSPHHARLRLPRSPTQPTRKVRLAET